MRARRHRGRALAVFGGIVLASIAACAGDEPGIADRELADGGPRPNDGSTASGDGARPAGDASSDSSRDSASSGDGASGPCPVGAFPGTNRSCAANTSCNGTCCFENTGPTRCALACNGNQGKNLFCDSASQCGSIKCCLFLLAPLVTTKCPHEVAYADLGSSGCDANCAGTDTYEMCREDSACTGGAKCRAVAIKTADVTIAVGVCL